MYHVIFRTTRGKKRDEGKGQIHCPLYMNECRDHFCFDRETRGFKVKKKEPSRKPIIKSNMGFGTITNYSFHKTPSNISELKEFSFKFFNDVRTSLHASRLILGLRS